MDCTLCGVKTNASIAESQQRRPIECNITSYCPSGTVSATCFSTALLDSWLQFAHSCLQTTADHPSPTSCQITHHQPLVRSPITNLMQLAQQHYLTPGFSLHTDSCLQIDCILPITNLLSENTTRYTAHKGSPHNVPAFV